LQGKKYYFTIRLNFQSLTDSRGSKSEKVRQLRKGIIISIPNLLAAPKVFGRKTTNISAHSWKEEEGLWRISKQLG
jgi:exosome complex RNA-binding protein Rrp4